MAAWAKLALRGQAHARSYAQPARQPPPEKCEANACAKRPNPPRVTLPEPESDESAEDCRLDEASLLKSLLKKLLRDDHETWPPPDEDPRGGHCAADCRLDAMPGCPQFSLGISA